MPLLPLIIHNACRLARTIWVSMLNRDEILVFQCRGASEGKWRSLNWPIERPPYVYDAEAALEELFGFVWEMEVYARCGGFESLVDVDAGDRCARGIGVGAANCVVKEEDAVAARYVVEN